jgi:hypothetical protein
MVFELIHRLYSIIALANLYADIPSCRLVLLGRWALELPFSPTFSSSDDGAEFPPKVRFIEPLIGFYLSPELKRRRPQVIETGMAAIFRQHPPALNKIDSLELDVRKVNFPCSYETEALG